jgi:hypothetical protein
MACHHPIEPLKDFVDPIPVAHAASRLAIMRNLKLLTPPDLTLDRPLSSARSLRATKESMALSGSALLSHSSSKFLFPGQFFLHTVGLHNMCNRV